MGVFPDLGIQHDVVVLQADATTAESKAKVKEALGGSADCVLSDLAPRLSGIRDAAISAPAMRKVGSIERYVSCVRFSARTPGASPSGREYLVIFLAGKLDQMGPNREQCKDAAYQPFPELERLKR